MIQYNFFTVFCINLFISYANNYNHKYLSLIILPFFVLFKAKILTKKKFFGKFLIFIFTFKLWSNNLQLYLSGIWGICVLCRNNPTKIYFFFYYFQSSLSCWLESGFISHATDSIIESFCLVQSLCMNKSVNLVGVLSPNSWWKDFHVSVVSSWGFPLSFRSGGNKWTRHRHQVSQPPSVTKPVSLAPFSLSGLCAPPSQFLESVGSCLRCAGASRPAEGALGLFYRPAVQGHWERSQIYLTPAVFSGTNTYFWEDFNGHIVGLRCRPRRELRNHHFCVFCSYRNGRFPELWGLWTLSAPKLLWVCAASPFCCARMLKAHLTPCLTRAGNHSCVPNAEASFPENNFLLHLCALSDINPGEVSRSEFPLLNVGLWWTGQSGPLQLLRSLLSDSIRRLSLLGPSGFVKLSERLRSIASWWHSNATAAVLLSLQRGKDGASPVNQYINTLELKTHSEENRLFNNFFAFFWWCYEN